uniref:VDE lipocalin domain-containing protein n=1 Tax=Aureoumbra lagunensis TaxID=44058 RepID=A0A7S3K1U5_9STRA
MTTTKGTVYNYLVPIMMPRFLIIVVCITQTMSLSTIVSQSSSQSCNWKKMTKSLGTAMLTFSCSIFSCGPCFAENELSALGSKGFDASLIDTTCMKTSCEASARRCLESGDCRKGLTCTAKCMGDNECITGCFAKYGNDEMNDFLECSVDANGCIKIAILPPGPDSISEAPVPPVQPLKNFDPSSLKGEWYKVMGWNPRYDCFDCQKNSFSPSAPNTKKQETYKVDVAFDMPRPPRGNEQKSTYSLRLSEELVFDSSQKQDAKQHFAFVSDGNSPRLAKLDKMQPAFNDNAAPKRHATTVGHLFGLTFWENWSVLAQNAPEETEEWKFVYYSGKTTQNTYTGAFVYARTPDLKPVTLDHIYTAVRNAGFEPETFCSINNDCCKTNHGKASTTQIRPPTALTRQQQGLFVGAATAAEDPLFFDDGFSDESFLSIDKQHRRPLLRKISSFFIDVTDYLEDPHATSKWLFDQQKKAGNLPPQP